MAVIRVINGEKKVLAEVNKLETINGLQAEQDKNSKYYKDLRLAAYQIPFFTSEEEADGQEYKSVRDKITELAILLGATDKNLQNNWDFTNWIREEVAVANKLLFLQFNKDWNYIPATWVDPVPGTDDIPGTPGKWDIDPSSRLHEVDPVLAARMDAARMDADPLGNFALIRLWWIEMQEDAEANHGTACPVALLGVRQRVEALEALQNSLVKTVNGAAPDPNGAVTIDGGDIPVEFENDEFGTVAEEIKALIIKTQVDETDKVLTWDDDDGLLANVTFEQSGNILKLLGKDDETGEPFELGKVELTIGTTIAFASVLRLSNTGWEFDAKIPETVRNNIMDQAPDSLTPGGYLILGFFTKKTETDAVSTIKYTFANLSEFIVPYTAGDGIVGDINKNIPGNAISVKIDRRSSKELTVSEAGIRFRQNVVTETEFDEIDKSKRENWGIYFVVEDSPIIDGGGEPDDDNP